MYRVTMNGDERLLVDFMRVDGDTLVVDGALYTRKEDASGDLARLALLLRAEGDVAPQQFPVKPANVSREVVHSPGEAGRSYATCSRFSCSAKLPRTGRCSIEWTCGGDLRRFTWRTAAHNWYSPLSERMRTTYFVAASRIFCPSGDVLVAEPLTFLRHVRRETAYCMELATRFSANAWKALALRVIVRVCRPFVRRPIWIFSDRVNKADDNGRAMYEYVLGASDPKTGPRCVFAVTKNSPDYAQLRAEGRVVDILSLRYKLMLTLADFLISAYRTKAQCMPFDDDSIDYAKDIVNRCRFVYLRHGVSYNDLSGEVGRAQINARIIVSSVPREYESILRGGYGYTKREAKLCGLPRYDRLYNKPERKITFLPTWRSYLVKKVGACGHKARPEFRSSAYLREYMALFGDVRLRDACAKRGYALQLMMHPNMVFALKAFEVGEHIKVLPLSERYRDIFATSDLIVTDYSSVAFDFAYLKKPVLYFHADHDEFFSRQYTSGYYDWERDGFGEVETSVDALVTRLIEYMDNECAMKQEYQKRVDDFFAFTDKGNCRRVYEAILEADREDGASS